MGYYTVIGIDPGFSGGVAILNPPSHVSGHPGPVVVPMATRGDGPDKGVALDMIHDIVTTCNPVCVYVEKAQAMPHQGGASIFRYGREYGRILGMLCEALVRYVLVSPRTWQKVAYEGVSAEGKNRSIIACQRLYPSISLIPQGYRKPHDGMADALLIAHYGLTQMRRAHD